MWARGVPAGGLHAQLVGDGHDHFEDGHEGGDLAEVAAADHLGVDLQAPLVVLARHAAADLVEPVQDVVRELRDWRGRNVTRYYAPPFYFHVLHISLLSVVYPTIKLS